MDPAGAVFTAAMLPVNSVRRTPGTFDFMDFTDLMDFTDFTDFTDFMDFTDLMDL